MEQNIAHLIDSFVYALIGLGVFFLSRIVKETLYKESENEYLAKNNLAVALNIAGFYLSVGITILAALSGETHDFIHDILSVIGYSFMGVVLISVFARVQFYFIIGNRIRLYLKKGNIAAGLVAFGVYLNIGIVTLGAFFGEGSLSSAVVFFVLGQITLIIATFVWERINKFDVASFIKDDNVAGAVIYSLTKISLAVIIFASIRGNFVAWVPDLLHFVNSLVAGFLFVMILFNKILDKFVLPKTSTLTEIQENNVASAVLLGFMKLSLSFIIAGII